jgi:hypothetical protein
MVPIKKGPSIKLKSLKILLTNPPLTVHHLNGIDKILSIITMIDAKIATGVYIFNAFLGMKKTEDQEIISKPILISTGNKLAHSFPNFILI